MSERSHMPLSRGDVEAVVLDGEAVVYDPLAGTLHRLNASATAVWQRCDGQRSVAAVTAELAATFGTTPSVIERDVRRMLDELRARGLVGGTAAQVPGSDGCGPSASSRPSVPTKRRIE
jgi:PqqD family protein of HPr-rel-A system